MKRVISIIMVITLLIALAGCGETQGEADEINVYMLNKNEDVEVFLESYKNQMPGIELNIEVGINDYDTTVSDALKKLNTKILSGKGPDIIVMDDINLEKYIESNQLSDLTAIVEQVEGIPQSILDNCRRNGKIPYIPLAICLIADLNSPNTRVSFESLEAFNNGLKTGNLKTRGFESLSAIWYRAYLEPKIESKKGIDRAELKSFFQELKWLMYCVFPNEDEQFASFQQFNLKVNPLSRYNGIYYDKIQCVREYISSPAAMQSIFTMKAKGQLDFAFDGGEGSYTYIPQCILTVNQRSRNKKGAEELISYLLSQEGQENIIKNNLLPVNDRAMKTLLENTNTGIAGSSDGQYQLEPYSLQDQKDIFKLYGSLKKEIIADANLMEIVMIGAQSYLNKEDSLDNSLNKTMRKLEIYLSE